MNRLTLPALLLVSLVFSAALAPVPARAFDWLPSFGLFGSGSQEGEELWKSRDQYVRIVPQDEGKGGAAGPNNHPVELDPMRLRQVLAGLEMWQRGGWFGTSQKTIPVFSDPELDILSRLLASGLSKAQPDQDVVFVVAGMHGGLVSRERKATAGRVFYRDGRLNLIFGDLHRATGSQTEKDPRGYQQEVDRRVFPFNIGSRSKVAKLPGTIGNMAGVGYQGGAGEGRGDWLVIDVDTAFAALQGGPGGDVSSREAEMMRLEAMRLGAERRQMREEMARMRKEMREMGGGAGDARTVEERLSTLDELKQRGLISDQEYADRRQAILDDI